MKTASVRLIWEIWHAWGDLPPSIWCRQLRAWEEEYVNILSQILSSLKLEEGQDILYWSWSGKSYSTKDCYMALTDRALVGPVCVLLEVEDTSASPFFSLEIGKPGPSNEGFFGQ